MSVGNTAKLVPYCKLIAAEGATILGEPFIVSGDEKFYADKVKLRDASGKVVSVEIKAGTSAGFTFTVDGDTFKITSDVDKSKFLHIDPKFTWNVEDNVLTIGGVKIIQDYSVTEPPWKDLQGAIKKIILSDGVVKIPAKAFAHCPNVTEIELPSSITDVGEFAFSISFCGNSALNAGRNIFWYLEDGVLIIKKNSTVKNVDADFSIGAVSWKAARKNIRGFKFESGVVPNKTFFDWFIQRGKTMKLSAD